MSDLSVGAALRMVDHVVPHLSAVMSAGEGREPVTGPVGGRPCGPTLTDRRSAQLRAAAKQLAADPADPRRFREIATACRLSERVVRHYAERFRT